MLILMRICFVSLIQIEGEKIETDERNKMNKASEKIDQLERKLGKTNVSEGNFLVFNIRMEEVADRTTSN